MKKIKKYIIILFSKIFWIQIKHAVVLFLTDNIWGIKNLGKYGKNATIRPSAILGNPQNIFIDDYVEIQRYVYLMAGESSKIFIGANTLIGPYCFITAGNHGFKKNTLIRLQAADEKDVKIGEDAFIGAHSIVLPGVRIGDCAVIGAGSVVTKDVPTNAVAVGIPAKVVSERR